MTCQTSRLFLYHHHPSFSAVVMVVFALLVLQAGVAAPTNTTTAAATTSSTFPATTNTFPAATTMGTMDYPDICRRSGCECGVREETGEVISLVCIGSNLASIPELGEMPSISLLNLMDNQITVVKASDLDPIRERLDELNLAGNLIATVELGHLPELRILNLEKNLLVNISEGVLSTTSLPKLNSLNLAHNRLETLPTDTFTGRSSFRILNLENNFLTRVPAGIGQVLNYEEVRLGSNPIGDFLPGDWEGDVQSIAMLDISNLGLTTLPSSIWSQESPEIEIRKLYMDDNNISVINATTFEGLPRTIQILSLKRCNITRLVERSLPFKPIATGLRELYLDENSLGNITTQVLSGLDLSILSMTHCNLTDRQIKRSTFNKLKVINLDLSYNNFERISSKEFHKLEKVEVLDLSYNRINEVAVDNETMNSPFAELSELRELYLQGNSLTTEGLGEGLRGLSNLVLLQLAGNKFNSFPILSGGLLPKLEELFLSYNKISVLTRSNFDQMSSLKLLLMNGNPLEGFDSEDDTFAGTPNMVILDFDHTHLTRLPNMTYLQKLKNMHVNYARLTELPEDICCTCSGLQFLEASDNLLTHLPSLSCKKLVDLDVSHNLLETLAPDLLQDMNHIRILDLEDNLLSELDEGFFKNNVDMEMLRLGENRLTSLPSLEDMPHLVVLNASHNRIERLERNTFQNQIKMDALYLNDNEIHFIHPQAFPSHSDLKILDLSRNSRLSDFSVPSGGFPYLSELYLEELFDLHQVPSTFEIPRVTTLYLTYSYHCCIWKDYIDEGDNDTHIFIDEDEYGNKTFIVPTDPPITFDERARICNVTPEIIEHFKRLGFDINIDEDCDIELVPLANFSATATPSIPPVTFTSRTGFRIKVIYTRNVTCTPHSDALTPCQNLLDPWILKVAIWAVWVLALLGNGTVLFIGIATREQLDSSEILICNLAFADFCMGVYLAFLAIVDVRTFGASSFFQSALDWQLGPGCKTAGFIAVFSSEFSIYVLVVLTLERVYTIGYTFNQNERKKRRVAIALCVTGWFLAAILASLPFFGVNSYSRVAVCLPYLTEDLQDKFYIGFLLTLNFIGFLIILFSYVYIFSRACRNAPTNHVAQRRKDILVAVLKIAVVILTAFICWAPIAVIGYLALGDVILVDAAQAKYFIVFVYPINACVNPFIYAIFTRRFRDKFSMMFRRRSKGKMTSFPPHHQMRLQTTPSAFSSDCQKSSSSPSTRHHEEMMKLRHSRRANSLVVQYTTPNTNNNMVTASPTFQPPKGCNFGRRASLPAGFGSTLTSLNRAGLEPADSTVRTQILPHYPFPLGSAYSSNNSSLPNLQEETNEHEEDDLVETAEHNRTNTLTSSQESNLRRLSVVEEEEGEDAPSVLLSNHHRKRDEEEDSCGSSMFSSCESLDHTSHSSDVDNGGTTDLNHAMKVTGKATPIITASSSPQHTVGRADKMESQGTVGEREGGGGGRRGELVLSSEWFDDSSVTGRRRGSEEQQQQLCQLRSFSCEDVHRLHTAAAAAEEDGDGSDSAAVGLGRKSKSSRFLAVFGGGGGSGEEGTEKAKRASLMTEKNKARSLSNLLSSVVTKLGSKVMLAVTSEEQEQKQCLIYPNMGREGSSPLIFDDVSVSFSSSDRRNRAFVTSKNSANMDPPTLSDGGIHLEKHQQSISKSHLGIVNPLSTLTNHHRPDLTSNNHWQSRSHPEVEETDL